MILVFGKTGQLSMELQRFPSIIALGREKFDLSEPKLCRDLIISYSPEAVINAAAYTAVDNAEKEEDLAHLINASTPSIMAQTCAEINIPFIHFSTDYVFDGSGKNPWSTFDKGKPLNAYGRSKLSGEKGIQKTNATYAIIRTSWVFSGYSSNFVKTILKKAESKDSLNIISDQIGGPTPAHNIAEACLEIIDQLIKDPKKKGIYHFCGSPSVSWAQFASEIFSQAGLLVDVIPIQSRDFFSLASRPLNSRLDCSLIKKIFDISQPDWKKELKKVLADLEAI